MGEARKGCLDKGGRGFSLIALNRVSVVAILGIKLGHDEPLCDQWQSGFGIDVRAGRVTEHSSGNAALWMGDKYVS